MHRRTGVHTEVVIHEMIYTGSVHLESGAKIFERTFGKWCKNFHPQRGVYIDTQSGVCTGRDFPYREIVKYREVCKGDSNAKT